jgi:hypothetical protein
VNLFVSDGGNNRVLEYNTPLTVTAVAGSGDTTADTVFGQANSFTGNQCNFNGGPSNQSLCGPVGVALDSTADLLVGDFNNNRVLKFLKPLATPGVVTLSPIPRTFGNVAKGNSRTASVQATNTGSVPVLFSGVTITGINAADFKVASNTCSGYIKAATSCLIGLTFTPTSPIGTNETATLTVFDNGSNAPQSDTLSGTSATQTTVTPPSLAFGNVPHGTTSTAKTETLTNNQSVATTLSPAPNISSGSPTFAISATTCGASVPAFGSCTVSVTCSPATTGPFSGTLTITDTPDSLSPHNINLTCTGT